MILLALLSALACLSAPARAGDALSAVTDAFPPWGSDDWSKLKALAAENPSAFHVSDSLGRTPLTQAAERSSPEGVKIILAADPQRIKDVDNQGEDALMHAGGNGSTDTIKALLDGGADPKRLDSMGLNALMYSLCNSNAKAAETLIKAGCDVNVHASDFLFMEYTERNGAFSHTYTSWQNRYQAKSNGAGWSKGEDGTGWTPLFCAASDKCYRCGRAIERLAAAGAELDARDAQGRTALMLAAQGAKVDEVQALLAAGADPTLKSLDRKTAFDVAQGAARGLLIDAKPKPKAAPAAAASAEAPEKKIVSDVDAPTYRRAEDPRKFAVVVGIEKYKSLPAAQFAERDAAAVRAHLEALGYPKRHVVYLAGDNATRSSLAGYLQSWLPKNVKEDSEVFFYFSGHGAPDAETKKAYLVPWDASAEFLSESGYPLDELYSRLAKLGAARVVVALDSCFSGAGGRSVFASGARPLVTKLDLGEAAPDKLVVLAAASAEQISGAQTAQGHGLFTYYLLQGLEKSKGDSSVKALYEYAKPKVMDDARLDNREQTPQLLPAGASRRAETLGL